MTDAAAHRGHGRSRRGARRRLPTLAQRSSSRRPGLPLQHRRRADQRHRHRHRRSGRFVSGLSKEDFRLFEDGERAADHALQQRARAGEPGDRRSTRAAAWTARRWRPRKRRSTASCSSCSIRTTKCSSTGSTTSRSSSKDWTTDRERIASRPRAHPAARRDGAVRRGGRGGAARADRPASQEGARRHLGRQRHEQPDDRARAEAVDSRDGSARLRDRHRRAGDDDSSAGRRQRRRQPQSPPPARDADSAAVSDCPGAPSARRRRRSRPYAAGRRPQRVARGRLDDRVNVAALRDITDDSGGRTEIVRSRARSRPGDGRHRRRVEQAVLPRLPVRGHEGRPVAHDPSATSRAATTSCARARATSRRRSTCCAVRGRVRCAVSSLGANRTRPRSG